MKLLFASQCPKEFKTPEGNEDYFEFDSNLDKAALSDGASESFDARTWARTLVHTYMSSDRTIDCDALAQAIGHYRALYDQTQLTWSKAAAFERGSFATLLGLQHIPHKKVLNMLAVGDTVGVLLDDTKVIGRFPFMSGSDFMNHPTLLGTKIEDNAFVNNGSSLQTHQITWNIGGLRHPCVLCMTDALAAWAISNAESGEAKWQLLRSLSTSADLEELVREERAKKQMRLDDVTLLVFDLSEGTIGELPYA